MRIEPLKLFQVTNQKADVASGTSLQDGKTFSEFLTDAIQDVNKLQHNADKASLDLAAGRVQDVSQAVIAAEKAAISLQLTMQVRNKIVDAYQEVMRMQV